MGGRLAATVVVTEPATGVARAFGPGDKVPDWAAELITNPKAWEPATAPEAEGDEGDGDGAPDEGGEGGGDGAPDEGGEGDGDGAPEDGGGEEQVLTHPAKNASRADWVEFATAHGVEVTDEMTRPDIQTAVQTAGI